MKHKLRLAATTLLFLGRQVVRLLREDVAVHWKLGVRPLLSGQHVKGIVFCVVCGVMV